MTAPIRPSAPNMRLATPRSTSDAATAFLDTLRATAASLVVLSHVILVYFDNQLHFWGRGFAVQILFILSGFLITQSLLQRSRKPGPHFSNFLADRMARILTPLVPVVLVIALLNATVIQSSWGGDGLSTGFVALVGNWLLLLDHPVFQALAIGGVDVSSWRIRPYNTAEPYWTVAIEFWLYIAASLFVFGVILKENIRRSWVFLLAAVAVPVVVWNSADGPGKSLSLIWMLGAAAGCIVFAIGRESAAARSRSLWLWLVGLGLLALAARGFKMGFDPYDLQTATLVVTVFLGLFLRLNRVERMWRWPARVASFFASYSYSLYLVHNTVLVVVFEHTQGLPKALAVALGVGLAHLCAILTYHAFEKRHRTVGTWLRPRLERWLMKPVTGTAPVPAATPAAPVLPTATGGASSLPTGVKPGASAAGNAIGGSAALGGAVAAAVAAGLSADGGDAPDLPAGGLVTP